jgi:hypothetical protein
MLEEDGSVYSRDDEEESCPEEDDDDNGDPRDDMGGGHGDYKTAKELPNFPYQENVERDLEDMIREILAEEMDDLQENGPKTCPEGQEWREDKCQSALSEQSAAADPCTQLSTVKDNSGWKRSSQSRKQVADLAAKCKQWCAQPANKRKPQCTTTTQEVVPTVPTEKALNEHKQLNNKVKLLEQKLNKYQEVFPQLKVQLEESNLQNARLHYQNRVLNSDSLNERQKDRLVETISKAKTVEEAKIIYETLQSAVGASTQAHRPKSLNEVVTKRSSAFMPRKEEKRGDPLAARMKALAGITDK